MAVNKKEESKKLKTSMKARAGFLIRKKLRNSYPVSSRRKTEKTQISKIWNEREVTSNIKIYNHKRIPQAVLWLQIGQLRKNGWIPRIICTSETNQEER